MRSLNLCLMLVTIGLLLVFGVVFAQDTFPSEVASITPVSIDEIIVTLTNNDQVRYSIQIRMSDETIRVRTGDLLPHLTTAQKNAMVNFMDQLNTKAEAEFLP